MRILFLAMNYWPEETGSGVVTTARCEYLASRGHEVTICSSFPYYPEWRIADGYRRKLFHRERHNNVDILRSFAYIPATVTSAKRIIHEASFIATSAIRALASRKPELIVTISPPLGLSLSARMLSTLWRIPYVFHVEDVQPDAAADLGMLKNNHLMRALYALERAAYRRASLVSTLTGGMRDRILSKGVPSDKVTIFSHWAEQSLFNIPLAGGGAAFRKGNDLNGKFVVLHAGNMGVKQGLEVILGAAERARSRDDIVYLLVGDGAARRKLQAQTSAKQLGNVRFLPLQPRETFHDMLAAADLCLVTQRRSVADIAFPSKTVTLLAAGRPVVASVAHDSQIAHVVRDAQAGIETEPENSDALLTAILDMQSNEPRRAEAGAKGRAYARNKWNAGEVLPVMERELLDVAARHSLIHVWPDERRVSGD